MLPAGVGSPIGKTLNEIIDYARKLKQNSQSYAESFNKNHLEKNAFSHIFTEMIMLNEQLHFYGNFWCNIQKRKKLKIDDSQRINRILTWTFIRSFSVIEYVTKELILNNQVELFHDLSNKLEKGEIVSIKKIIDQSNPALITDYQNSVWDVLREIRNASVHNDGRFTKARAPKEGRYSIGKITIELKFNKEYQLHGDLDLTLKFVELLMELHYLWLKRFFEFN